jgi:hypothetical protein
MWFGQRQTRKKVLMEKLLGKHPLKRPGRWEITLRWILRG